MKRGAILIEASDLCGGRIPGAKQDVILLNEILISDLGGAWELNEIAILHNPSYYQIINAIAALSSVEYAFISYSGHGYHAEELDETKVCTIENQGKPYWMPISQLLPRCPKYTLSIDCCRNVETEYVAESIERKVAASFSQGQRPPRFKYRQLFDSQVEVAEIGGIKMYSCDLNESAGETSRGGYFTRGLVKSAYDHEPPSNASNLFLPMSGAFDAAYTYVETKSPQQHPQFEPGRRNKYFPFAVYPSL